MNQPNKKILFAGGGSGGPVTPLLAVANELKKTDPSIQMLFVGTSKGPERKMIEDAGFSFKSIPAAKFRRYFSLSNFTDVFVFIYSLLRARKVLSEFKPDLVFSAGGFVAVPLSWMAKSQGIKVAIHQQDAGVGLSNRMISPMADLITTAFERTSKEFHSGSGIGKGQLKPAAVWAGNPVRQEFFQPLDEATAKKKFGLNDTLPILLIVGGATGASQINEVAELAMPELVKTHQVIHVTGQGKMTGAFKHPNYHPYEFLSQDFSDAMKLSEIVIARAGLGTIAEVSALGKIAIIVPMPDTHQEANAALLSERSAAVVLNKQEFNPEDLPRIVRSLKFNVGRQKLLTENVSKIMPHDAAQRIAKLLLEHVRQ